MDDWDDPILSGMVRRNEPITLERYLLHAYTGRDLKQEPLQAEVEAMLPDQFRDTDWID